MLNLPKILMILATLALPGALWAVSPAVEAIQELPRTEPQHYVEAVLALVDLGEPEKAEAIAQELATLGMTDVQQIELLEQVGTARLSRLGRLYPVTAPVVAQALATAHTAQTKPEKLNRLTTAITTGTPNERLAAMRAIRQTGMAGVYHCLDAIATADDPKAEARLREALVALDPLSRPALLVATGDRSEAVRTEAAYALGRLAKLGRLKSSLAVALLAGRALIEPHDSPSGNAARWACVQLTGQPIDTASARQRLAGAVHELLSGTPPLAPDHEGLVAWRDAPSGRLPAHDVALRLASRLTADHLAIAPDDIPLRRQATLLHHETLQSPTEGLNLAHLPTHEVSACLVDSLEQRYTFAAVACCDLLGERRDTVALVSHNGRPAPLADALLAPHPAVRFAALRAVMTIDPQTPFPGSSRVVKSLLHFASAEGNRTAIAATPQLARSGELASRLLGEQYRALPYRCGSDTVEAVQRMADVELVLLDLAILRPVARETLYRVRSTPEGRLVPVVLLAPEGRLLEAQAIADEHHERGGLVLALPRLSTTEGVASMLEQIRRRSPRGLPDAAARQAQGTEARGWIGKLLADGPTFYRVRRQRVALEHLLGGPASESALLADLGTPASQTTLLERASSRLSPITARQAAAEAFGASVATHGLLLTSDQIMQQYERYNASESADEATQSLLGKLLDIIESRRNGSSP